MSEEQKDTVKKRFGASSEAYATSDVHAKGESLAALVELLGLQKGWSTLDVGTGAGHTALAVAAHVSRVVATDITEEMLARTMELARARGLENIEARVADAEALPFDDGSFDVVTCRLAFHHFSDQDRALSEFARVLKGGGTLGFVDNVTVTGEAAARYYNDIEKLRDPSHIRVHSPPDLASMIEEAGFRITAELFMEKEMRFGEWTAMQRVSEDDKRKLLGMFEHMPEELRPLLKPRYEGREMFFYLREAVIVATK